MEYYSAKKKKKKDDIWPLAKTWMDIENMLSEISPMIIDTNNRIVTRKEMGWGRAKWIKGVKYMVKKRKQTLSREHARVHRCQMLYT